MSVSVLLRLMLRDAGRLRWDTTPRYLMRDREHVRSTACRQPRRRCAFMKCTYCVGDFQARTVGVALQRTDADVWVAAVFHFTSKVIVVGPLLLVIAMQEAISPAEAVGWWCSDASVPAVASAANASRRAGVRMLTKHAEV